MTGRARRHEDGFTLIEVLVGIGLFLVLGTAVMTTVLTTARATEDVRSISNLNEEARLAVERMTRELRQAREIRAVHLPTGANPQSAMTFGVDFNGNGILDEDAADPEVVTYRYEPNLQRITFTANDPDGNQVTRPILAANVTDFSIEYRSTLWQYDGSIPSNGKNGITDWSEIDASSIGNKNGLLDAAELEHIDVVAVTITVLDGARAQTYITSVHLRNRNQS